MGHFCCCCTFLILCCLDYLYIYYLSFDYSYILNSNPLSDARLTNSLAYLLAFSSSGCFFRGLFVLWSLMCQLFLFLGKWRHLQEIFSYAYVMQGEASHILNWRKEQKEYEHSQKPPDIQVRKKPHDLPFTFY